MKRCVIFGAGEYDGAVPPADADLYIAADAGLEAMCEKGIAPDLAIGDFDSLKTGLPEGMPAVRLPTHKDVTDLDAAVAEGIARGCDTFYLYGVLGGRPDHSFANLSLIARLSQEGKQGWMFGAGYRITAIRNGALTLPPQKGGAVSVFSFTDKSEGVTIRGLEYGLEDAELTSTFALGVSNAFTGAPAEIGVKNGILLIMAETS